MRQGRVFARLLGFEKCVIEGVQFDGRGALLITARPAASEASRCGVCRRRCPGYDQGGGERRWRALDFGVRQALSKAGVAGALSPPSGGGGGGALGPA